MSLFVSTVSTSVVISELGITIPHPTVDFKVDGQFDADEISRANSLTDAITSGLLVWKKISGGSVQTPSSYDPDYLRSERENTGTGAVDDRVVTFKDLAKTKSGEVPVINFSGNPKKATVTFTTPFPTNNYTVNITGTDARLWTIESKTANSFIINANANAAIISLVGWQAQLGGEVG